MRDRYRLNRSGDRQANHVLWRIALRRMSNADRTKPTWRGRWRGKSKPEIVRVLKRYIAREVFRVMRQS